MTKAATVSETTDLGEFTAIVSTGSEDREGDVVKPGAFTATIKRWRASGKLIPLAWAHSSKAEDIVGVVDPAQMWETSKGLVVGGKVDLETERGQQVWRLMRSGSLGFSFG